MIPSFSIMNKTDVVKDRKIELLAPAGDMLCLNAAIMGGADAIYLAGEKYGARAGAVNFGQTEILQALDLAHIHGKKIYLTLNTLIKEREFGDIYGFLIPMYEHGLDGVIIQDTGLIDMLKSCFPLLPIHASTQMTLTHEKSVNLLLQNGVDRVVLARELSYEEIRRIKEKTDAEIEVFVHGAMCYSYSGACLFSSFLGGRSGNRGRCAGPCRLPYDEGRYLLSLRDMCYLEHIDKLMDAGVDSFKIEGRLKAPEYVYAVTSIYRKYIDAYLCTGSINVAAEDIERLGDRYLRGGKSGGYLFAHNDTDMVTIASPSYKGNGKDAEKPVNMRFDAAPEAGRLHCSACFHVKQPMRITLLDDTGVSITVKGDEVEKASKRAATEEEVKDRLCKTGGTGYKICDISLELDDDCFLPVAALNELRRKAIEAYKDKILGSYARYADGDKIATYKSACINASGNEVEKELKTNRKHGAVSLAIKSVAQFDALDGYDPCRIYIPYDLIYSGMIKKERISKYHDAHPHTEVYIRLPRIFRQRSDSYMDEAMEYIKGCNDVDGILVCNLEELSLCSDLPGRIKVITDHDLYVWNDRSYAYIRSMSDEVTAPLELSLNELQDLSLRKDMELVIYGRAPLMVSAGCVQKTRNGCNKSYGGFASPITDRYGKKEPVYTACLHCYNEIYNSVPTSYHKKLERISRMGFAGYRIELTDEDEVLTGKFAEYYLNNEKNDELFPVSDYTTGHMDKGAI